MRHGFAGMAMDMDLNGAVVMMMTMEMHADAPQPPQHMRAWRHLQTRMAQDLQAAKTVR